MTQIRRRKTLQLSARQRARRRHRRPGRHPGERAGARLRPDDRRCTGCAGPISCPPPIVLLKGEIVEQCQKDLGIKLTVETINANDIQARITAAIQSGAGPDIIMTLNNWPQLYADSCADVSDVAERTRQGAGRLLRHLQGRRDRRRQVDRRALVHRRRPRRLSQILARRSRFAERIPDELGRLSAPSARS